MRVKRFLLRLGIALGSIFVVVLILGMTSERFTNFLMIPITENQGLVRSDVIIVLGAGSRSTTPHLPPQAYARVQQGVSLLLDGWAPKMVVSGGYSTHTGLTEAPLMATIARTAGARPEQVIEEPQSKNTWENATDSLAIMQEKGWASALVVTSPYHTYRACAIFHKQGANVRCIAAPLRTEASHTVYERLMDLRSVLREYGAIIYFYLKHYI